MDSLMINQLAEVFVQIPILLQYSQKWFWTKLAKSNRFPYILFELRLTTNEVAIHWFLYCFKLIVSVKSLLNNWILLTKSLSVSPTRLKFYLYLVDNRTAERCVTIQPNAAVVDHTCRNADSFHHFRCNRCRKTQKLFRSSGKSSHSKIHVCIWAVWHRQNFICTWKSESDIIIGFSDLIETLLARYILV